MNEELKKKIQKELLDPIKDPRRVMKMEYLFSHKYILIAVIIAVDLFLIMAFSFLFHMVGMIPRILGGREIQLFALRNFLPDFTKMPIQGGLAALLIIFIADAYLIYRIRVCNTTKQQEYWKHIAEKNQNPDFEPMIRKKISELEYRERYTVKKEFFLQFFWKTEAEIKSGRKAIESVIGVRKLHGECGITELLEEISPTKKEQVLFKIANKNSQIF